MLKIIILLALFLINGASQNDFSEKDCEYLQMNDSNNNCSIEYNKSYLFFTCSDFWSNYDNKLPNISAKKVKVVSALTKWPCIPRNFINTTKLDFSYNQIDLIGDLSNCPNLKTLNCSFNRLIKFPESLIQVIALQKLDLSYNLIEILDMEFFVSSKDELITYFVSEIRFLNLSWNKIKIVNNMDLFIFGLPVLIQFDLRNNQISRIDMSSPSQITQKINSHIKDKLTAIFLVDLVYNVDFVELENYVLFLNDNQIKYLNFAFSEIFRLLMEINKYISVDYLYVRFASIYLGANKINCSCGLFEDFYFLINGPLNKSKYFKNLNKSLLASTECKISKNESINLISNLITGSLKRSQFCEVNNEVAHLYSFYLYQTIIIITYIYLFLL